MQNYILHIDLVYRYFSDFLDFVVENSKSRVLVYNHSIPKLRTPWTAKTYALYDIFRPYPASRHQHPVTHNANLWLGVADVAENAKTDTIRTIRPWTSSRRCPCIPPTRRGPDINRRTMTIIMIRQHPHDFTVR